MTNSFPDRLRDARVLRGYSQTDLASLTGIAPGQVNRYEAGKNTPRPHVLAKLSTSLGVRPEWLRDGTGQRDADSSTPSGRPASITLSFTEAQYAMLQEVADSMGLSVSDALPKLLKSALSEFTNGSASPEQSHLGSDSDLREIKSKLADLQKQVAQLANGKP